METGLFSATSFAPSCLPNIRKAPATEFEMVNPLKASNFVVGELVNGVQLSFIVENLPKTSPQSGCPGRWMFEAMMAHFGAAVTGIQGNWVGTASDNLTAINTLTTGGIMTIEEAAKQTWTGLRAKNHGFTKVHVVARTGVPGQYLNIHVLFTK